MGKVAANSRQDRLPRMRFGGVYPLYVKKAERKGRTQAEVDEIIAWLTGYSGDAIAKHAGGDADFDAFFTQAPAYQPRATLVTGVVCGVRVESIEDPIVQKVRVLDKLIDELAKGKAMEKILR